MSGETVWYEDAGERCKGYLVAAAGSASPRPGVVIAHAWGGQKHFERERAARLAALGYVGFALDVYGEGATGADAQECSRLMAPWRADRRALRQRLRAGVEALAARPEVDAGRIGAIGFCFGGLCALDLARDGAPLRGVVSFHGILDGADVPGSQPASPPAKVLICHGYDDPMATPKQLLKFASEMTAAGVDWQAHVYGGTVHAFTNPAAHDQRAGMAYSEAADRRSWRAMAALFEEAFA